MIHSFSIYSALKTNESFIVTLYCTSAAAVVINSNCDLFLPFPSTLRFKQYKKFPVQNVREQRFCQFLETDCLLLQRPTGKACVSQTAAQLRVAPQHANAKQ
jgi:hypothetical protein